MRGPGAVGVVCVLVFSLLIVSVNVVATGREEGAFPERTFYVTRASIGGPRADVYGAQIQSSLAGEWTVRLDHLAGSAIVVQVFREDGGIPVLESASKLNRVGQEATAVSLLPNMVYRVAFTPYGRPGTSVLREMFAPANVPPVACFTVSPPDAFAASPVTFDASCSSDSDGVIISYAWDFGDGSFASGVVVAHEYAAAGLYLVTLTLTDDDGGSATLSREIVAPANQEPVARFFWEPLVPDAGVDTVTFDGTASYDPDYVTLTEEEFDVPTLDPAWRIWTYSVPPPCPDGWNEPATFSLTDNPGYLRFYPGSFTVTYQDECVLSGYWYYPSTYLYREIETTSWTLETHVTYSAPSANAAWHDTFLYFGDLDTFSPSKLGSDRSLAIMASVWDDYHQVWWIADGVWTQLATLPINHGLDAFFYRLTRSDDMLSVDWSRDGVEYDTATTWTLDPDVAAMSQAFGLSGQAFWSDPAVVHSEYAYVRVRSSPGSPGISSYEWDFGDGTSGDGPRTSHLYALPGEYPVTLTVTDEAGASGSLTQLLTVAANEPPVACFQYSPTEIRVGTAVSFDAVCSSDADGAIVSYQWDFGDGTTAEGLFVVHAYTATGTYVVTLSVTDNSGASSSTSATIFIAPPSNDDFDNAIVIASLPLDHTVDTRDATTAPDDPACAGQGHTVWYSYTPGEDVRIESNTFGSNYDTTLSVYTGTRGALTQIGCNDDTIGLQSQVSFDARANVTYYFMVGAYGSNAGGDLVFRVDGLARGPPIPCFSWSPPNPVVGAPLSFDGFCSSDADGVIVSYDWDFGDGTTMSGPLVSHAYSSSGTFTVTLRVVDDDGLAATAVQELQVVPIAASLAPPHADFGLDTDGDGPFNWLVVDVSVSVVDPGTFYVGGYLCGYNASAGYFNCFAYASNATYLDVGLRTIRLLFDGIVIRMSGLDGPYRVDLNLYDASWRSLGSGTHTTAAYSHSDFEAPPASLAPPHVDFGLDTDGDGLFNYLAVDVYVDVVDPGTFYVNANLCISNYTCIAYASNSTYLDVGLRTIRLSFDGMAIRMSGLDGPYNVSFYLSDSWRSLGSGTHTTAAYSHLDFEPLSASLAPPHSDYGLDTDGDGLFNELVVLVRVDVNKSSTYQVTADLMSCPTQYNCSWIASASSTAILTPGTGVLSISFDGVTIRRSRVDGPYTVRLSLYETVHWWYLDSDTYTTVAYGYLEFEQPAAVLFPPHLDAGVDTDGDGLYNYLTIDVSVEVVDPGTFYLDANLCASNYTCLYASNYTFLAVGLQTIRLLFDGVAIRLSRVDGPYVVNLRLYDAAWRFLGSATHLTAAYVHEDFDALPGSLAPPHTDYGVDTDGDGLYNELVVGVGVDVVDSGTFYVNAYLCGYNASAGYFNCFAYASNSTYLDVGLQTIRLSFDGLTIRMSGLDGPYRVDLNLYDASWRSLGYGTHTTAGYSHLEFEFPGAAFSPPHADYGLDTDGDGLFNVLVVEIRVEVAEAGTYYVSGSLCISYSCIGYASNTTYLDVGLRTIRLSFDGLTIRTSGLDGPYNVSFSLSDSQRTLGTGMHRTTAYRHLDFEAPPAALAPPHADYGLDTDGDGYFDQLIVAVRVDVVESGWLNLQGDLCSVQSCLYSTTNSTFLEAGTWSLTLSFDGLSIRLWGVDGPYLVRFYLYDSQGRFVGSGNHTTAAYSPLDFEEPPASFAPPHSDAGLDSDGDGLYNELVMEVHLDVADPGWYMVSATLSQCSSLGNCTSIAYATVSWTFLEVGLRTIRLSFDGVVVRLAGVDGPYTVSLRLEKLAGWGLIGIDVHTTTGYSHLDFEPPPASLVSPYADFGSDTDGDGLFNALVVEIHVEVLEAGIYYFSVGLVKCDSWGNCWGIAFNYTTVALDVGTQTVLIYFDGLTIRLAGLDGPYTVDVWLRDSVGRDLGRASFMTAAYSHLDFEEVPASLSPPHSDYGLDTDGDGLFNVLVVEASIDVVDSGAYQVYATLCGGSHCLGYASGSTILSAGRQAIHLFFEGLTIWVLGFDGPYSVELSLYWLPSGRFLGRDTFTTAAYGHDLFENPPPSFLPPHSDHGLDTDGDGLFNVLIVDVSLDIADSGTYRVSGSLYSCVSQSCSWIYSGENQTFLERGRHTVRISFEGFVLRLSGMDGPYTVELWISGNGTALNMDRHITAAYAFSDFEEPPASLAPPHTDFGLDTDGDGLYNTLVVELGIDVSVAGRYYFYANICASACVVYAYNTTDLDLGHQTVRLLFDGYTLRTSGLDGPYSVTVYMYDDRDRYLDHDTYLTAVYAHSEFDGS